MKCLIWLSSVVAFASLVNFDSALAQVRNVPKMCGPQVLHQTGGASENPSHAMDTDECCRRLDIDCCPVATMKPDGEFESRGRDLFEANKPFIIIGPDGQKFYTTPSPDKG